MYEVIFLFSLALIWIIFATLQDIKSREVANWLNFSLIVFALGFRLIYSLFSFESGGGFNFFYHGLIGLGIFFIIGNIFYYGRIFAGGDAKLMIALGAVLPISLSFLDNLKIFAVFFILFLLVGICYGLISSFYLALKNFNNFKGEFYNQLNKIRRLVYIIVFSGIVFMIIGLFESIFFFLGLFIFLFPYFYLYAKAVDEACMIKNIHSAKLTEGDWLYKDVKVGKKLIKAKWDGLTKSQIKEIKKRYKNIKIRQGIPFIPVFLISFLVLSVLIALNHIPLLWDSFW